MMRVLAMGSLGSETRDTLPDVSAGSRFQGRPASRIVPERMHPLYWVVGAFSQPVLYGLFRLRVSGREHLPDGGFVLAANHVSNFDPWPMGLPLWPERQLRFMAKSELFNPVF